MRVGDILKILGATSESCAVELLNREPLGYSIDSRSIRSGDLFFAIKGDRFDGHDFVSAALGGGAIAAVVSSNALVEGAAESALIRVPDPLAALQTLASAVLTLQRGPVIAVTGSVGKTSTKEMTAATLAGIGRVAKTVGNLNNDFGLPLSILRMESDGAHAQDFDFAVLEMGMNHKGEIARLASIAPPEVGVVTLVAPVHLEFFASIEEIAAAKAELVMGIQPGGLAVLNADDELVARMSRLRTDIRYRTFGVDRNADVRAREVTDHGLSGTSFVLETPRGSVAVKLSAAGRHNITNALAAAAVADFYEAPLESIASALSQVSSSKMRGEVIRFPQGFAVVDDSYNSNPTALVEMTKTISASPGFERKLIVAGEMLELGGKGAELHRQAGRRIAELGIDFLIGVRGLAEQIVVGAREGGMPDDHTVFCSTPDEAAEVLMREARAGDLILVKGSRGVRTEIVISRLKESMRS